MISESENYISIINHKVLYISLKKYPLMGAVACTKQFLSCSWLRSNNREHKGLIMGDYSSGRTTILYNMKLRQVVSAVPTVGFNVEKIENDDVAINLWDMGGGCKIRQLWHHYYDGTDLLVYVIDGSDRRPQTIQYNRNQLIKILKDDKMQNVSLLIVINKVDLGTPSLDLIKQQIDFEQIEAKDKRIIQISALSIKDGKKVKETILDMIGNNKI